MNTYGRYFAIAKKMRSMGIPVDRKELIGSFTKGEKYSLKDLTQAEYDEFIMWLSCMIATKKTPDWKNSPENQMRRKIIALFFNMGYREILPDAKQPARADMSRIKQWVLKYGYLHKPLNDYTADELPKLVSQVENIWRKHVERYGS